MSAVFGFDFEVEPGDGKYRVTVTGLAFTGNGNGKKERISAAKLFLHKGDVKAGAEQDLECLEAFFGRVFTMSQVYKNKP